MVEFRTRILGGFGLAFLAALVLYTAHDVGAADEPETTNLNVLVVAADTGQPIANARLTLSFKEGGAKSKVKRSRTISYSAKTGPQGRYKFTHIPKGTILLMVTAEGRQSYGKEFELATDDQLIEVKLRKPQPLL